MAKMSKAQHYNCFLELLGVVDEVEFNTGRANKFVRSIHRGSYYTAVPRSTSARHGDTQPYFKETPQKDQTTKEGVEKMLAYHGVK